MNRFSITALFLCSLLPTIHAQPAKPYQQIVDANNRFALKFLKQAIPQKQPQNVITGPAALSASLAFLLNGASVVARQEIQSTIGLQSLSLDDINQQNRQLLTANPGKKGTPPKKRHSAPKPGMDDWTRRIREAGASPTGYLRAVGFFTPGPVFDVAIADIGKENYDLEQISLRPNWDATDLDRWINSKLMDEPTRFPIPTRNYQVRHSKIHDFKLIDASLYNGLWRKEFESSLTAPAKFHIDATHVKTVPLMHQSGRMAYFETADYQAVKLPYRDGHSFTVVLPRKELVLPDFIANRSDDFLLDLQREIAKPKLGDLYLPRFEVSHSENWEPVLRRMGVNELFDTFSSLGPLFPVLGGRLVDVQCRSRIKVDEIGTKIIVIHELGGMLGGVEGSLHPEERFLMRVDRPFLYFITDDVSGEILFLGTIVEP